MTAIISVKHPEPRFEGQTKTKLDNPDANKVVGEITGDETVLFFDKNLDTLKKKSLPVRRNPQRSERLKKKRRQTFL